MQDETQDIVIEGRKGDSFRTVNVSSSKGWIHCTGETKFGHPRIFLDLSKTGVAICPYCSCHYIVKE